ncbi:MAG: hypothetical protein PHN24_12380 [Eubacteriales bacterium]|nr:hypothetical protein [Eubacteriales bacterium]
MAVFIAVETDGSEKPQTGNTNHSCRAASLIGVVAELVKTPIKVVVLLFLLVKHQRI